MTNKQNPELTLAYIIDNNESAVQTDVSYTELTQDDINEIEVGDNVIGSFFTDVYIFKDEFVGSFVRTKLEEDMSKDKSYTILVFNVESTLDLKVVEEVIYHMLTKEDATLGAYEFTIDIKAVYAFRSDNR